MAIGWGTPLALVGALVYAVNHSFIKAALLMLTGVVSSRTVGKTATKRDIGGVGKGMVLTSLLYLLGGMALAGLPPLNGFISKVALVRGGIEAQGWWALILAVAAGLITLQYMIGTWSLLFQQPPDEGVKAKPKGDAQLAPLFLIGLCVLFGVYATPLIDVVTRTVADLGDPTLYIRAVFGG